MRRTVSKTVDPQLIELELCLAAAKRQIAVAYQKARWLWPEIKCLVSIRTIMLALSIVVITCFGGTRDLGRKSLYCADQSGYRRGIVADWPFCPPSQSNCPTA